MLPWEGGVASEAESSNGTYRELVNASVVDDEVRSIVLCRTYAAWATGAGEVRIYKRHFTKRSGGIEGGFHKSGDSKSKMRVRGAALCSTIRAQGDVGAKAWNGD